ncbi:MAG: hypothetical protein K6G42_04140 [Lachnospiraceae bacterium]|nr:hypothetical protein [Lachnospiraceae bacterium]
MKNRLGDIAIIVGIVAIIGVLIFMKKDAIMEALNIETKEKAAKETEEPSEAEASGDESAPADAAAAEPASASDGSASATVSEGAAEGAEGAAETGEGISVKNNIKVTDPLLEANNVKEPEGTAVVPEAGLIENNIIGASWTEIKENYSYTDFEAEEEDIAQLRFLVDGNLKYYQSPASGEIFGVQDDTIVAYLKRWEGTPLNQAIAVEGLFDSAPYIYQCTDHLNFYEWKIANCYVGLLVEDTGDGLEENAPLYAESYVLQRRINSFYK